MRKTHLFLAFLFIGTLPIVCDASDYSVNSIIGDKSFIEKFGVAPITSTNENLRITTHLEHVENCLRQKDVQHLSVTQQQKRVELMDLLHEYWTAEIFPRNYDYSDCRIPCFIDRDGRICAVGYLIEKTAGREVAEAINRYHQYENILSMNDEVVDSWIESSGLTAEECAMIQPTYGYQPAVIAPSWTSGTFAISPTKKEIKLTAKVDSLESAITKLKHEIDSLNLLSQNQLNNIDSLNQVDVLNKQDLDISKKNLESESEKSKWLIISLVCLGAVFVFALGVNYFRNRKAKTS